MNAEHALGTAQIALHLAQDREAPAALSPRRRGQHVLTDSQWQAVAQVLRFSGRELELVKAVFDRPADRAVAQSLGVSVHTVRTHFERLYRKTGVNSRVELAVRVFEAYLYTSGNAT